MHLITDTTLQRIDPICTPIGIFIIIAALIAVIVRKNK